MPSPDLLITHEYFSIGLTASLSTILLSFFDINIDTGGSSAF